MFTVTSSYFLCCPYGGSIRMPQNCQKMFEDFKYFSGFSKGTEDNIERKMIVTLTKGDNF